MLKTARIATGDARAEGRQPSHDGEFITIIYNTNDPSAIIAEHNAGTFCLDEVAYPPEGLDEEQEAAYRAEWNAAQSEAYEAARKDTGEPLVRCGSEAREEIVELGWATVANFDGDYYAALEYVVRGLDADGNVTFYTGRAGAGWVSPNRAEAFTYSVDGARAKAMSFNRMTALHGLRFVAAPRAEVR